jgi:hypothetical protein
VDTTFRSLDIEQKELLEKLLEPEFEGRDELRSQLSSVTARQASDDGTLILHCGSGIPSPCKHRVAVEGVCKDADGMNISVLLHVDRNGFMKMLEILKDGISPIINPPKARDLVFTGEHRRRIRSSHP